jgi:hypothetical protein
MPNELKPTKPLTGEVILPNRTDAMLYVEPPLQGVSLFNRMHYRAVRKELEAYLDVLRQKNAIIAQVIETARLGEELNRGLVRAERMDDLRLLEHLRIDAELDEALAAAIRRQHDQRATDLIARTEAAELEARALEAEKRLKEVRDGPAPAAPQRDHSRNVTAEIEKIRREEKELIGALIAQFGSEDALPEADRELVQDVRFATRNRIADLIDELGR